MTMNLWWDIMLSSGHVYHLKKESEVMGLHCLPVVPLCVLMLFIHMYEFVYHIGKNKSVYSV
ncbi:MAG: hypothetical protein MESAZ_00546 [Saezia sanguinis]